MKTDDFPGGFPLRANEMVVWISVSSFTIHPRQTRKHRKRTTVIRGAPDDRRPFLKERRNKTAFHLYIPSRTCDGYERLISLSMSIALPARFVQQEAFILCVSHFLSP